MGSVMDQIPLWLKQNIVPGGPHRWFQEFSNRFDYGLNPFDREWDILIILDACRYDLFETVVSEHPISDRIKDIAATYSCASATNEWLEKISATPDDVLGETYYVSGSGHIDAFPEFKRRLKGVEDVWKYGHDEQLRTVPADIVTNAAIRAWRRENSERFIIHYVQPHAPFVHCAGKYGSTEEGNERTHVWQQLEDGIVPEKEVWQDYSANLHYVLEHVDTLIENVSGTVAITSDHGNGFGECGVYGHPIYYPFRFLRHVPWSTAVGGGAETYTVQDDEEMLREPTDTDVKSHLEHLGYLA